MPDDKRVQRALGASTSVSSEPTPVWLVRRTPTVLIEAHRQSRRNTVAGMSSVGHRRFILSSCS